MSDNVITATGAANATEEHIGATGQPTVDSYDATPPKGNKPITTVEYRAFQRAYDFFNAQLFDGSLPHVLVTLQRRARTRGYFSPDRFSERTAHDRAHELALNPDAFTGRTDEGFFQRWCTRWRTSGSKFTASLDAVAITTANGPKR